MGAMPRLFPDDNGPLVSLDTPIGELPLGDSWWLYPVIGAP